MFSILTVMSVVQGHYQVIPETMGYTLFSLQANFNLKSLPSSHWLAYKSLVASHFLSYAVYIHLCGGLSSRLHCWWWWIWILKPHLLSDPRAWLWLSGLLFLLPSTLSDFIFTALFTALPCCARWTSLAPKKNASSWRSGPHLAFLCALLPEPGSQWALG